MPDPEREIEEYPDEVDHTCELNHVEDLDDQAKTFLSTFTTIRSKITDVERAESDLKRFELSLESERKRLQKQLENARLALRNARIQMATELTKVDGVGFTEAAKVVRSSNGV